MGSGSPTIKGHTKQSRSSSVGSAGFILFSMAFILIAAMGGATFHYRKMIDRIEHELMIMKRQKMKGFRNGHMGSRFQQKWENTQEDIVMKGEGVSIDTNDDEDANTPKINPQDMNDLRTKKQDLQGESHKWSTRASSRSNDILALQTQIKHFQSSELVGYNNQITGMQTQLKEQGEKGKSYKEHFVATHKAGSGGIVPGGPGHALVQRKEIESMESLDDYEDYVQKREDALWTKIDLLVEKYGKESKREAEEWFGPGTHKVELEIEYPQYTEGKPPSEWPRVRGVFQIEMAPLSLMPIAVNLFLQQVHHKLWNGCSFVINAMHILQAGPHQYKTEGGGKYNANVAALVGRFENARLDKMPFQEYNSGFPHDQYTLGFAGRPGGPDFYINKIDNSVNHGPGGQSHHDLHEEADPCFAKLVGGMGILGDLNKIPIDRERGSLLLHPVVIVDSRVMIKRVEPEKQLEQSGEINNSNDNAAVEIVSGNKENDQKNNSQGSRNVKMPAMGPSPGI